METSWLFLPLRRPRTRSGSHRVRALTEARLFLTSALVLFTELLLIRWIPANVIYVGYFTNFLLMGSFLGIGVGILLGRGGPSTPSWVFPPLLLAVVALVYRAQLNLQLGSSEELFFGLTDRSRSDASFLVLPLVTVLTAAVMASLALPIGPLLRALHPLRAYAFDIAGSLAGIAGFAALSALQTPPVAWFAVVAAVLTALGSRARPSWRAAAAVLGTAGVIVLAVAANGRDERWSPYYRVGVYGYPGDWAISVNGIGPHQRLWATSAEAKEPFYEQVYRWYPGRTFDRVLVIGAGSGTDTGVALVHGVARIDAVEIDPVIASIGAERHPDRPYDDRRVSVALNDGRAFLRNSDARYDLVVYALTDSLVLASSTANLRLESFLFTKEAFESVRDHLTPSGVLVLYNFYREEWLLERYAAMLEEVFGAPPVARVYPELCCLAGVLAAGPGTRAGAPADAVSALVRSEASRRPTDDWPFPYLRAPGVPPHYVLALAFVLLLAVAAVAAAARATRLPLAGLSPHFFALGAAFLLLETRSLATFGLLFGTTWIVNALVFFAILVSVLLAILVTSRVRAAPGPLYAALALALAVCWALPPATLLIDPPWLRYVLASAVAFAPIFTANLVFAYSFRDTRIADMAFASNLLGAMTGGVLEYLALLSGYQSLLVVAAALYLAAYLLATRWRVLADRRLASA